MSDDRGEEAIRRRPRRGWGRTRRAGGSVASPEPPASPPERTERTERTGSSDRTERAGRREGRERGTRPEAAAESATAPSAEPSAEASEPSEPAKPASPSASPASRAVPSAGAARRPPAPRTAPDAEAGAGAGRGRGSATRTSGAHGDEDAPATDRDLLARHVAGDPDAFSEIVRRHRDRLWAVALRTLKDREEAADAVQDALVSAYRSAHTFRGQSAVTTWLHRITVNACLDRARKAATRRTTLTDDTERLDALLEPHESAAAPAERGDLHRQLIAALAQLPVEQRAALVLVDMQGYPVAEAAQVLDVAVGTVKSRCARGRARLLPLLAHLRPNGGNREKPADDGTAPPGKGRNRSRGTSVPPQGVREAPGAVKGGGEPT